MKMTAAVRLDPEQRRSKMGGENHGKVEKLESNHSDGVVVIRPTSETMSRQRLPYYVGISETTSGAKNISMNLIVIPPAGAAEPHLHKGYETAFYLLKGRVAARYGHELEKSIICQEGDFILIKPDVPHQPINLDPTKPALAIVARNDPNEQESVVHYSPQRGTNN
jgi:uncharacterized RmlC-like cupin family protein